MKEIVIVLSITVVAHTSHKSASLYVDVFVLKYRWTIRIHIETVSNHCRVNDT